MPVGNTSTNSTTSARSICLSPNPLCQLSPTASHYCELHWFLYQFDCLSPIEDIAATNSPEPPPRKASSITIDKGQKGLAPRRLLLLQHSLAPWQLFWFLWCILKLKGKMQMPGVVFDTIFVVFGLPKSRPLAQGQTLKLNKLGKVDDIWNSIWFDVVWSWKEIFGSFGLLQGPTLVCLGHKKQTSCAGEKLED